MLNNKDTQLEQLRAVGLTGDEAKLYLELLRQPSTHLRLAHATGINRTKVYRLAQDLEKRSLVTKRTDDRGTFLVALDPSSLAIELTTKEEKLELQRQALDKLWPDLHTLQQDAPRAFAVHTYEGTEGFKQMLWHELKTKGENLLFGGGTIGDLVGDHGWAERHRQMTVEAGYHIRELLNPAGKAPVFTLNTEFMHRYKHGYLPPETLLLQNQISVYNDTVATYHWRESQKVGVEIVNRNYAHTMRQIFENYWQIAKEGEHS